MDSKKKVKNRMIKLDYLRSDLTYASVAAVIRLGQGTAEV